MMAMISRQVVRRVFALMVPVLGIVGYAAIPDPTREAVAYLKSDLRAFVFSVTIRPPTGDDWNPGFELRSILLHVRPMLIEPLARWPTNHPISTSVQISSEEARRVIEALARLHVFDRAAGAAPSRVGAHCLLTIQGPPVREAGWRSSARRFLGPRFGTQLIPPLESATRTYLVDQEWDGQQVARRLRVIRRELDGEGARAFDALIRQIPSVPR